MAGSRIITSGGGGTSLPSDLQVDVGPTGSIAETIPRWAATVNGALLATQRTIVAPIYLRAGQVVTNITFVSGNTALGTGNHQYFGLYNSALNSKLAESADDTSTAWAGITAKTLAMTAAYTVTASGNFYLAILVDATTVPTLTCAAAPFSAAAVYALAPVYGGITSGTSTSLPASLTLAGGGAQTIPYAYVS